MSSVRPRLTPLRDTEWDPGIAALLQQQADAGSRVGDKNIFATLARAPHALAAWAPLARHLLADGALPERDRELAILRTAWRCRARYEWGQHVLIATRIGIKTAEIDAIARDSTAGAWSERERAVLNAADELHTTSTLGDATWATLAADYSDEQLIELILTVGQYHLVAYALNALSVQPENGLPDFPASQREPQDQA